jgi:hypothetical protein
VRVIYYPAGGDRSTQDPRYGRAASHPSASTHTGTSRPATARRAAPGRPSSVPIPARPPTPGSARRRRCRRWAMTSGPPGRDQVGGRPGVAHHPLVASTAAPDAARPRPGRSPTGRDARDALGVLVVGRAGHRPARRHVRLAEDDACGSGSSGPSPMSTRCTDRSDARPARARLQRAEGDGRGGRDGRPSTAPCRDRRRWASRRPAPGPRAVRDGDELGRGGRSGPRPERPTMPSSTRSARAIGRSSPPDRPRRPGHRPRRRAASPGGVGPLRVEQHRADPRATAAQLAPAHSASAAVVSPLRRAGGRGGADAACAASIVARPRRAERGAAHQAPAAPGHHRPFAVVPARP